MGGRLPSSSIRTHSSSPTPETVRQVFRIRFNPRRVYAGEAYTSKCATGNEGRRVSQGFFKCSSCGLEYNADLNGAINIGEGFLGHWLRDEGVGLSALRGSRAPKHGNWPQGLIFFVQSQRPLRSLPLYGSWRLVGDVVYHPAYLGDLVSDSRGDPLHKVMG